MNFDEFGNCNYKYMTRMEHQNMTNLLNKSNDQPSKFRTRKWVEVSDDSNGTYKTGMQIKFYIFMLMSSLRDYSAVYIFVKGTITIAGAGVDAVLV